MNDNIRINFIGDISLGELFENINYGVKSQVIKGIDPFQLVKPILESANLNIANIECVISDITNKKKPFIDAMRCPSFFIKSLTDNHIHILNIANNHILDHGDEAFEDMIKTLKNNNIVVIGNRPDQFQDTPVYYTLNNTTIALIGMYIEETVTTHYFIEQKNKLFDLIKNAKAKAQITIISLHWGHEYTTQPKQWQIDLAKELFFIYEVDIIYGHHPHSHHGIIEIKNKIFAPSMGNFIFDELLKKNRISSILQVNYNTKQNLFSFFQIPIYINKFFQPRETSKYRAVLLQRNSQLYKLFNGIEPKYNDNIAMKECKRGHLINRLKIRILVLLRFRNYYSIIIKKLFK